ncbi:MAG: N-acetylmuramoyl-L-alanine amidase [Candidatus Cloacimonetes bacterium]|nr:N-acetylmuramoyl-L-alanine amidase [Candidatus Cloacimonadota bacterium]
MSKIIFLCFLLITCMLWSTVIIEYEDTNEQEKINVSKFDDVEYFNVYELNKVFRALVKVEVLDSRLYVNMYEKQIIFLLDSSYVTEGKKVYNFTFPIIQNDSKYYIPVNFLQEILPLIYPEQIFYKIDKIIAPLPDDNRINTIVLDPGHGGKDPGAIGFSGKVYEKDITLAIAEKLKAKIEAEGKIKVFLTRSSDRFVSLRERTEYANEIEADLFISIHVNAHADKDVTGIEVYYLSTARTDDARATEALENAVVYNYEGGQEALEKYNDLDFILTDMAQNEYLQESHELCVTMQNNVIAATGGVDRGVKQADFYVLRGAFMPAVLIESGFITNKKEEKKLAYEDYQEKLAQSLFSSLDSFIRKIELMH